MVWLPSLLPSSEIVFSKGALEVFARSAFAVEEELQAARLGPFALTVTSFPTTSLLVGEVMTGSARSTMIELVSSTVLQSASGVTVVAPRSRVSPTAPNSGSSAVAVPPTTVGNSRCHLGEPPTYEPHLARGARRRDCHG